MINRQTKQQSGSDGFVTFLNAVKRRETSQREGGGPGGGPSLKLLAILAGSGPQPVPELLAKSGMTFAEFVESLNTLRDLGLIALVGQKGTESAELTPNGAQVERLARS